MEKEQPYSEEIRQIEAIAVVGPTAVGKSAVVRNIVQAFPETYHKVGSFTTRSPRTGEDEGCYDFITPEQYEGFFQQGQVVQSIKHDTNGHTYGSLFSHYDVSKKNIGDFSFASIEDLRRKVGGLTIVGIVACGDSMIERIDKRWQGSPEMYARMAEAVACLEWIELHADVVLDTTGISNHDAAVRLNTLLSKRVLDSAPRELHGVADMARMTITDSLEKRRASLPA